MCLSRVLVGARATLGIGVGGVALAFLIGVPLGVVAAWRRGWIDAAIMRVVDVMLSFPDIVFALGIVAILGANTQNVIVAVGIVCRPSLRPHRAGRHTQHPRRALYRGNDFARRVAGARRPSSYPAEHLRYAPDALDTPVRLDPALAPPASASSGSARNRLFPNGEPCSAKAARISAAIPILRPSPACFSPARRWPSISSGTLCAQSTIRRAGASRVARHGCGRCDGAAVRALKLPRGRKARPPRVPRSRYAACVLRSEAEEGLLEVVRGVDLELRAGRTLAVVGESGSGKSTLLRAIATLLNPEEVAVTGGTILIGGDPTDGLSPAQLRDLRRRKIGIVFQDAASALNPVLTVGAQLAEAVRIGTDLTTRVVRERCIALLRDVGISDPERRLDMYPHQFSGGMKQRIVIAIALAQDPHVLLADEPTSALDVTIQQQILTLLRELQKKLGMAILIVTHDLNLVGHFADDVAVMYAGRIVESGDVATVLCEPLHPYTQALRASVPGGAEGRGRPLPTIAGEPPMVGSLPAGCAFRARCERTRARAECVSAEPSVRIVAGR